MEELPRHKKPLSVQLMFPIELEDIQGRVVTIQIPSNIVTKIREMEIKIEQYEMHSRRDD